MNDMREVILHQAEQITHSMEVNKDVTIDGDFDSIVLAGMGGSGHPGDLLNALGLTTKPLFVHRNYDLPLQYLGGMGFTKTVCIASSYSGNTEEPLSAYQAAMDHHIPTLASASGGKLQAWAERDGVPFCKIDYPGLQPRHTLFAAFTGIYTALLNSGLVRDITDDLTRVANVMAKKSADLEKPAKQLAHAMKGSVVVFNSSDQLGFAAKNLKIQVNENAKTPAFWNTFPELNHNEMTGLINLRNFFGDQTTFHVTMLRSTFDHPRVKARMDVTSELYEKWGAKVSHITIPGESLLENLCYATTFGLWLTYHLAIAYDIDPEPVAAVEEFKTRLDELVGNIN